MKRFLTRIAKQIAIEALQYNWSRQVLNKVYRRLGPTNLRRVHRHLAKVFRHTEYRGKDAVWIVDFAGKTLFLPLERAHMWLHWDTAVSVLGHDLKVKQTYLRYLRSDTARPKQFVDIGANYGTHSLLLASNGVPVLSFEPNPACHELLCQLAKMNNVHPVLFSVALGNTPGTALLRFPEHETWLGTLAETQNASEDTLSEEIKIITLDSIIDDLSTENLLIKIDAEGYEIEVLRGAKRVLQELRPSIIFETWSGEERAAVVALLDDQGYDIFALPYDPDNPPEPLTSNELAQPGQNNMIATARK